MVDFAIDPVSDSLTNSSALEVKSKIAIFSERQTVSRKNYITFLRLVRYIYMQKYSELYFFKTCHMMSGFSGNVHLKQEVFQSSL